jgi:hypothetical protein
LNEGACDFIAEVINQKTYEILIPKGILILVISMKKLFGRSLKSLLLLMKKVSFLIGFTVPKGEISVVFK